MHIAVIRPHKEYFNKFQILQVLVRMCMCPDFVIIAVLLLHYTATPLTFSVLDFIELDSRYKQILVHPDFVSNKIKSWTYF
jgi:hypothetical protein